MSSQTDPDEIGASKRMAVAHDDDLDATLLLEPFEEDITGRPKFRNVHV